MVTNNVRYKWHIKEKENYDQNVKLQGRNKIAGQNAFDNSNYYFHMTLLFVGVIAFPLAFSIWTINLLANTCMYVNESF